MAQTDESGSATRNIKWSNQDALHALLGVIPGSVVVATGNIESGIALAIGLLPASLMGIQPKRRQRLVVGGIGALFSVGILLGTLTAQTHTLIIAAVAFAIGLVAALWSANKPLGLVAMIVLVPSFTIGIGFAPVNGFRLAIAFLLSAIWTTLASLIWPEREPETSQMGTLTSPQARSYGILFGLAGAVAVLAGSLIDPAHLGWTGTATLLIMRPLADMVRLRGIGRALSTIAGSALAVLTLQMDLGTTVTAVLVALVTVFVIATRSSVWYFVPFGTAYLILTLSLYDVDSQSTIGTAAWLRVLDNVVGAAIALFFGLVIPLHFTKRRSAKH